MTDEAQTEVKPEAKTKAPTKAEVEAELADVRIALGARDSELDLKQRELDDMLALVESLRSGVGGEADNRPSVFEAWSQVMAEVQNVSKDSRNTTGSGFNFRGIDAVMNAVGPALRRHSVIVVPEAVAESSERYETKNKAQMIGRVIEVRFRVFGPRGDYFAGSAFGEAADSGDKAISKAHSVAYRTFLLQSLTIPTDEPDPDATTVERGTAGETQQPDRQQPAQQQPAQQDQPKTPADNARDELRTLAAEKNWDLKAVAQKFSLAMRPDGQNQPVDLRTASATDVTAFKNLLATGAITL